MELWPIHAGMFLLPGANRGAYPFSHSILVDSDVVCLIDAGCGMAALDQVVEIASPDLIVATHNHPDHISGCWMFDEVPIHAPVIGSDGFGQLDALAKQFVEPSLEDTFKSFIQGSMGFESCRATDTYDAGTTFDFGQARLVAIHTPGHSDDHMCFFDTASGVLLSADIDLTLFGPWYGTPESDIQAFEESIRELMDLEPRVVVSSHEGIIRDDIQGRFKRYLDIIRMRHGAIAELVREERTLEDLTDLSPIYRGRPFAPRLVSYWERVMIQKHLELLILENRVQRTARGYVARRAR